LLGPCRTLGLSRTGASLFTNCFLAATDTPSLWELSALQAWFSAPPPVSVAYRTSLGHSETEIENNARRLPRHNRLLARPKSVNRPTETGADQPNPLKCRRFCRTRKSRDRDLGGWLGWQDSNPGMAESKSSIQPFGYAQLSRHRRSRWLDTERLGGARETADLAVAHDVAFGGRHGRRLMTQGRSGSTSAPECAECGGQTPKPSLRPSDQFTSPPGVETPEISRPICCSSAGRQGTRLKPSPSSIMANRPPESCVEPTSWPLT